MTETLAQCGNTDLHPGHPWTHPLGGVDYSCPGLDGSEAPPPPEPDIPETGPLSVLCPGNDGGCGAPPGHHCRTSYTNEDGTPHTHYARVKHADLRALEHGTCDLCGAFMVRGTVLDAPLDAWHPDPGDASRCPDLPDPATDWNNYAAAVNLGAVPGRPGLEHFQPAGSSI